MTEAARNRAALDEHLEELFEGRTDIGVTELHTDLTGWSFYQARPHGDRRDPRNWAVRSGEVIADGDTGLDLLSRDLAEAGGASSASADDLAIAVVSITRTRGDALTSEFLADKPFWVRWRRQPLTNVRGNDVIVRCTATRTDRGAEDETLIETLRGVALPAGD